MIRKTVKVNKRRALTWQGITLKDTYHIEKVRVETWWLLWIIPIYSRQTVIATTM